MESGPESTTRLKVSKTSTSQTGGYEKTLSFATTSGQDYEVALCCLIFLRALRLASDFFLASNYAPAGQFDDVVLFYRTKEDLGNKYKAILLQAKHKEKTAEKKLTSSYPFSLKEYLDSYKKIRNIWEQSANVQGQLVEFHEILLVLFTNDGCTISDAAHDVTDSPDVKHLRDILDTRGRFLRISDAEKLGLPQDQETSDFIDKLILCTEQMSVQMADQILQQEIINIFRLSSMNVAQNIVSELKHVIKEWWKGKDEGRYLTKQSHEWTKIIEMQVTRLNGDNLIQMDLDFSEKGLEELHSIRVHKQCWVYIRDKYHATATRVRLLKALRNCLILDCKLLKEHVEEVEVLWGTDVCLTVVLYASEDSLEDLSLLLQRLQMAACSHAGRRLVVVSTEKQTGADWFIHEAQATWSVLNPATQVKLLLGHVDLQGKVVALRDVIGSDAPLIMSEEVILSLCDSEKDILKLGASFPTQLEYYVPRCMQRIRKAIEYDTLRKSRTLIFTNNIFFMNNIVFGGLTVNLISQLKAEHSIEEARVVLGVTSDSEIRDLCCRFCVPGCSGVAGPEGFSGGLVTEVMEFIPLTFLCEEKVVVVEGVSGVGKSSFVTDMCSRVKERFPECWVLRVNMGKHSEFISERNFTNDSDIKEFLLNGLSKHLHCLAKKMLEHSLYVTGNVFLFLDAFDEISPDFTTKCCDLLKSICKMVKYRQLVVTTRPVTTKQVEEALGTKAFHLPVFSGDEQRLFIQRFCKTSGKNVNDEEMANLQQSAGLVLEIPLLCKLAAEVLLHSDEKFLLTSLNPWKKIMLYQSFIVHSIRTHLAEKFHLQISKPRVKILVESITNWHIQDLETMAVRKFMSLIELSTFCVSTKLPEEKFGLVVDNGESVDYEHETFAEYFFGCWLARNWQNCSKILPLDRFFQSRYEFVLQTMSWFLFEDIPLHKAVAQGDVEAVGRLLSPGTIDRGGRSALHVAAMTQCIQDEVVDLLLTAGEDTNKKDDVFGSDAVKYAEYFRNWEFVEIFLKRGKKFEGLHFITDQTIAITALCQITELDLTHLFQFLYSRHIVNFNDRIDHSGATLLHVAAFHNSTGVMKFILENTTIVNIQTRVGITPLFPASQLGFTEAVRMLLEFGADPNIRAADGSTALMEAAFNGHLEIVKLFLEARADPNIKTVDGRTALMSAAFNGRLEIVKLFLEARADPNIKTVDGRTALMVAAGSGHLDIVKLLITFGEDPNIIVEHGKTALTEAVLGGHLEIAELLIKEGANPHLNCNIYEQMWNLPLGPAIMILWGRLIDMELNPKYEGEYEVSMLMLASNRGHREIVKLLLEKGVDPNITTIDCKTALMLAAKTGRLEVVKLLLENGAEPTMKDEVGKTAATYAGQGGHRDVVKVLVENIRNNGTKN